MRTIALMPLLLAASPAAAQSAATVPGEPVRWYAEQEAAAAPSAPSLEELRPEALDRARWSTTTAACGAIDDVRLYGLQPATADRLVATGIMAGAFVGGWTFYGETGCADTPLLRYLYIAESDGRALLFVVNRGEAISTPSQMRETSAIAGANAYYRAKETAPDCEVDSVGMRATSIGDADDELSPPRFGTRFEGGWSEVWRFAACGQMVDVTVRFDADGKGGAAARITETALVR